MATKDEDIVLFHYPASIYSHRIVWYLKLAGIRYSECIQPPYLPRPDLTSLGINYRRMPILSIGRHVYCDSRLILQVLQTKYPLQQHASMSHQDKGIEKLFQFWTVDGGVFRRAVGLLPFETSPLALDPKFLQDRTDMLGAPFLPEAMIKARPESMAHIRACFDLVETTFLADGRPWISGANGPTTADIEAVWVFRWLVSDKGMNGALNKEHVNETMYPRTYAWIRRFDQTVANTKTMKPTRLNGGEARAKVQEAPEGALLSTVDANDPLGLQPGQLVEVWPIDSGMNHRDRGTLASLTLDEVCVRNTEGLLLHFPRWNFRIVPVKGSSRL